MHLFRKRYRNKLIVVNLIIFLIIFYQYRNFYNGKNDTEILENEIKLKDIVSEINKLNGFLIDINHIKYIQSLGRTQEDSKAILLDLTRSIFGIYAKDFFKFETKKFRDFGCECVEVTGHLHDYKIVTNVYIYCKNDIKIQIAIFYDRGDFKWIGADEYKKGEPIWFGDVPRALHNFETREIMNFHYKNEEIEFVRVPVNIEKYLFDYENSKFIECNKTAVEYNLKESKNTYVQNQTINERVKPRLKYISTVFESIYKKYWLASGTLLGWYRDCGIIPHTLDIDIMTWVHEYDERIKTSFLGNKLIRIWGVYGLLNDSLEFRLTDEWFSYDFIFVYKYNSTHQVNGFHGYGKRFRQFLPVIKDFCSAELLGSKYLVPCNTIEYLSGLYGGLSEFMVPIRANHREPSIDYKIGYNWNDSQLPYIFRSYDENGQISESRSLSILNTQYFIYRNMTLTKLPK